MSKKKVFSIIVGLLIALLVLVASGGIFAANHFYSKVEKTESLKPEDVGVIEEFVQKEKESNIVNIAVLGSGGIFAANHFYSKVEKTESLKPEDVGVIEEFVQKEKESNIVNIAVLGIDRDGDGSNGRSDAIKLISLDMNNKKVKITSFQRDTLIYIPEPENDFVIEEFVQKEKESNIVNIAVLGIDRDGDGSNGRSDAIKLISLDMNNKKVKITSFQRDTLIYIPEPENDFDKLNHAYWYGEAPLTLKTLNYNFDLDITRYVAFNFDAIEHIIDTIDGIELDVHENELKVTNDYIKHLNSLSDTDADAPYLTNGGLQTLSGRQAMAYMRNRYVGNDFDRMNRQNKVIEAMSYQHLVRDVHAFIYNDTEYQPSKTVIETEAAIYETFGRVE